MDGETPLRIKRCWIFESNLRKNKNYKQTKVQDPGEETASLRKFHRLDDETGAQTLPIVSTVGVFHFGEPQKVSRRTNKKQKLFLLVVVVAFLLPFVAFALLFLITD